MIFSLLLLSAWSMMSYAVMVGGIVNDVYKGPAIIHMKDGSSQEFAKVHITQVALSLKVTITAHTAEKNDAKVTIDVNDVASLTVFNMKNPEKTHELYVVNWMKNKKKGETKPLFCVLVHESSWGKYFAKFDAYEVNKEGSLIYILSVDANGVRNSAWGEIMRHGEDEAYTITTINPIGTKWVQNWYPSAKKAAEYFGENATVRDAVIAKKYKAGDIEFILDAMAMDK